MIELAIRKRHQAGIDVRLLRKILLTVLRDLLRLPNCAVGVHLIGAAEMTNLNRRFLRHRGSTDVLAFDYQGQGQIYGEIFISLDDAFVQARRFRVHWPEEVVRYAIHGFLHLNGHRDHTTRQRAAMKRVENRLLREVKDRFALARLGSTAVCV